MFGLERRKGDAKKAGLSSALNADTVDHDTVIRDYGICAARFRGKRKSRQSRYIVILNHGICTARFRGKRKPR